MRVDLNRYKMTQKFSTCLLRVLPGNDLRIYALDPPPITSANTLKIFSWAFLHLDMFIANFFSNIF